MNRLTELIINDMKPALGVTEPGAIAFAVAAAREHTEGEVLRAEVALNSGMYKNAFTCGIPNSRQYGNLYAAALGVVAAKAELGLESLAYITQEDNEKAEAMVADGKIDVRMDHIGSEITIDASVVTEQDSCTVKIRGDHTNIVSIEKNGTVIFQKEFSDGSEQENVGIPVIHQYTLHEILEYARTVPEKEIRFIRDAFSMNMELMEEGIHSERAVLTKQLLKENQGRIISDDALKTAQLLCNGAIEARVLGLSRPAMSITGSGAHGIIATMPLFAYHQVYYNQRTFHNADPGRYANICFARHGETEDELLLRGAAVSYLITMYIKEYSGRLSAFCGCGIAAGTGMACGLAFMQGAREEQIDLVIRNMASGLTGMICDGGNHGCAMKGIVAVDAAFRSVSMAMAGAGIGKIHGINGKTPEDTMRYMGRIASPGMVQTEKTIVEIMEQK